MIEATEYTYKTFHKKEDEPLDLGEYKDGVARLFYKVNLLEDYPDEDKELELNEHVRAYWLYLVTVLGSDNAVVGFGSLGGTKGDDELDLDEAYVDENHRRNGIYKNLVSLRIEAAKTYGAKELTTLPVKGAVQLSYLMSLGFQEYGNQGEYKKKL